MYTKFWCAVITFIGVVILSPEIIVAMDDEYIVFSPVADIKMLETSMGAIDWENKLILARVHLRLNEAGAARGTWKHGGRHDGVRRMVAARF